jgi:ferredoxin
MRNVDDVNSCFGKMHCGLTAIFRLQTDRNEVISTQSIKEGEILSHALSTGGIHPSSFAM